MFNDEDDKLRETIESLLTLYNGPFSVDDLLSHSDLDIVEALVILVREGFLELPEARPI